MPSTADDERAINISGTTFHIYWCYQCHRTVRIASSSDNSTPLMCPRCFGRFVYEIDIARPRLVVEFTEFDPSPEARILEALSLMLDPPIRQNNRHPTDVGIQPPWPRRRQRVDEMDGYDPESGILARPRPRPRPWIILAPSNLPNQQEGVGVDPQNYFDGSGLNELIEELTQNDRPGPPPAPDGTINALPVVKITQTHLLNDSQSCAVCMEDFKVGGEAKELPCNHIFHSDCIVPWLRLHNSCPVCRNELPVPSITTDGTSDSYDDSSIDGRGRRRRRRCLRWRWLASIWPFQTRNGALRSHGNGNFTAPEDSSRDQYSCCIL